MTTSTDKRAAWREANRERLRAYDRSRYPERAAESAKRSAAWRKANPERAREIRRKWQEANREKINAKNRERKDHRRRLKLGVDHAAFAARFASQGSRCAICATDKARKWALDHDHATGHVRGILCNKCNLGIGLLRDDPAIVKAAAEYLEQSQELQDLF